MGMSPGQDPPKFHLISVPIVQCKPPTFHVLSNELAGPWPTGADRSDVPNQLFLPNSNPKRAEQQTCHSSYPIIPQQCLEHAQAVLDPREHTEFHAQYFNTIPLKSNSQRKLLDQSQMAYKDQPPTYNPTSDPSKANGDTVEIMEPSSAEVPLDNVDHRRNVSQDVSEPSPNSAASNSSVNKPQSPKSVAEPGANAVGSNPQPDQATHQNPCQGSTHWMEQYLNELYSRKRWLTEALLQAEVSLKRLICEETAITGIWPGVNEANGREKPRCGSHGSLTETTGSIGRGIHDLESRATMLMNRLKWRQSRRSKSAHERLPTEYDQVARNGLIQPNSTEMQLRRATVGTEPRGLQSEINGSITVVRGNDERSDVTVPRRLLRWWRQNKRRSVVDAKRRQSMGFMSMHCPAPASGLSSPMELRTRGSSVPPNETRASTNTDSERFNGHSSERASLRLRQKPFSERSPGKLPTTYTVADPQSVPPMFNPAVTVCSYSSHPPNYQYVQLFTSNVNGKNGTEAIGNPFFLGNNRIHFLPCHQLTATTNPTSTAENTFNNGGNQEQSVQPGSVIRNPVHIEQNEKILHSYPQAAQMGPVHLYEYTNYSGKGLPNRWTTVRCRPLYPGTKADRSLSPPPLPPRVCGPVVHAEPIQNPILMNTRYQMQPPYATHVVDWTRSGVTALGDGPAAIKETRDQQRIDRRGISSANGPMVTTVKLAPHFQPISQRQSTNKQSKRWNPAQMQFTAIPKSTNVQTRARFPSVGGTGSASRITNGYEICPQAAALASRRVHSANVRLPSWDQMQADTMRNPFAEPLWQLRLGAQPHMDNPNIIVRAACNNGTGQMGRTFKHPVDSVVHNSNGMHHESGAAGVHKGVTSFDDCNAALRECLRGWELTSDGHTNWLTKSDPSRFVVGPNNSRGNPHATLQCVNKNIQWTRVAGNERVCIGSRNPSARTVEYPGGEMAQPGIPSTQAVRWNP